MKIQEKLCILIADDSSTLRDQLKDYLEDLAPNAVLLEAETGTETLEILGEQVVDILFMDVHMPEMSGIDALMMLRGKGNGVFVTLMATEPDEDAIRTGSEFGSYDFLKKPFAKGEIATILRSYMSLVKRKNVMIVDGSSTIRRLIYKVLASCRFDLMVSEVENGDAALELMHGTRPDIVFLDCKMSGLDCIQAARRLRAKNPALKLVMISSQDMAVHAEECREAGIFAFIKKPFYPNEVDYVLHRAYDLNLPHALMKMPNVRMLQEMEVA